MKRCNFDSKFYFEKREDISEEEYLEFLRKKAINTGYFLLAKRDYSIKELYIKLLERYQEKRVVEAVIKDFLEQGYLNDYEYARGYINTHSYGRKKMEFMLLQKGVSHFIIKELLDENVEGELENIKRQYLKLGNKERDKKIAALIRKGFQYRDIQKAIRELEES